MYNDRFAKVRRFFCAPLPAKSSYLVVHITAMKRILGLFLILLTFYIVFAGLAWIFSKNKYSKWDREKINRHVSDTSWSPFEWGGDSTNVDCTSVCRTCTVHVRCSFFILSLF